MTIEIQLTPALESGLTTLALLKGLPLNDYIQGLLESLAVPNVPDAADMTPERRADALRDWAEQFPYRRNTPLTDEAISRENIYHPAGKE